MFRTTLTRSFKTNSSLFGKKKKKGDCKPPSKPDPKPLDPCDPVVAGCKKICECPLPPGEAQGGAPGGAGAGGHGGKAGMWQAITCFLCLPAVLALSINHFSSHTVAPRPTFKKYDYMRIRVKQFPWGDGNHTLFHNPCYNALPEGYEDDECDEEELKEILKASEEYEERLERPV